MKIFPFGACQVTSAMLLLTSIPDSLAADPAARAFAPNRPPLQASPLMTLDLGTIKPRGWLAHQLGLQVAGLTGHAAQVMPELGPDNGWRGGTGESGEKGAYFLRGLVTLAYVSGDEPLQQQAQLWIDSLLGTQAKDGQLGPRSNTDWWPRMLITATLRGSPGDFRIDHGVNVSQAMKYPVLDYVRSGAPADRAVFAGAWDLLTERHGLPSGMWSGTESLAGHSTTQGVEMCSIVEQMLSHEVAMRELGDPRLGDQLERIAFNLLAGGTTKDFKQFQYYTLPNVPVATKNTPRELPFADDHGDDLLASPHSGFHCCCYNLHMGWPKYVQHSWMATSDGGLAALAYGPSEVTVTLAGTPLTLSEETDYPFGDVLHFSVNPAHPVSFPFKLRIPGWSVNPRVSINGKRVAAVRAGEFLTMNRLWKAGDEVSAEFPAALETRDGCQGCAAIWRGPLVFTLRIGESVQAVTKIAGGFDEVEMRPATPWNYALDMDRGDPAANVRISRGPMPENPWQPATTPIKLSVPARRLPQWGLIPNGRMAAEVPASPATSDEPLEQVTLVPFGAQTLRITAFPLLRGKPLAAP